MERMILSLSLRALGSAGTAVTLRDELSRLPGVLDVSVHVETGVVRIEVDPCRFTFRSVRPPRVPRSRRDGLSGSTHAVRILHLPREPAA